MGLVSLVTLTQMDDLGAVIVPDGLAGMGVATAGAADLPQDPAIAPAGRRTMTPIEGDRTSRGP